ncbi:MAG: twin-arginine translocation signal domain-containing protein [Planctomycetota bacterium]
MTPRWPLSRRQFLGRALTLAGAACVGADLWGQTSRPGEAAPGAGVTWDERAFARYLEYERERVARSVADARALAGAKVNAVPDYDRTLERVLLTLRHPKLARLFRELVAALPSYTEVIVVGPTENAARGWQSDLDGALGRRVKIVEAAESSFVEVWAQDVLERVTADGAGALVLPLFYRYLSADLPRSSPQQGRTNVDGVGHGLQSVTGERAYLAPVFFQGGDVAFDRLDDQAVVFTSANTVVDTQRYYRQVLGEERGADAILRRFGQIFGVSRVELLAEQESRLLTLHIDQNCCLLPGRVALVTRLVQDKSSQRPLAPTAEIEFEVRRCDSVRSKLAALNYRIVDIEVTPAQLSASQIALNGIPFRERESGQRTFLMPTWKNLSPVEASLQAANVSRVAALGIEPRLVLEEFHAGGGNLHCAVNVLS